MKQKYEEPRVMRELHAIRAKHYEETKHMTAEERARSTNAAAQRIVERYGLKLRFGAKH
jgi:shikimate kinase